ncbi:ECF transporter S component [Dermabacteraceae bacterium P9123]
MTRESVRATGNLFSYRTSDILLAATIAVAFGVIFRGYGVFYDVLDPVFKGFPPLVGLLTGIWCLPALLAGLIVRRPGAAVFAEVVAASIEALLGGKWALGTLISGVLQGLGVEIVLAVTGYALFTLPVAAAAGALSTVFEWCYERFAYYGEWSNFWGFSLLGFFVISGVVLCGVLGHALIKALAATGALNQFPPGREHLANR